jgi:hypothetical protein
MRVSIKNNIKDVTKGLNRIQKKQVPYATMNAINNTLFQLKKEMAKQTIKKLDRPTPATQKGFLFKKATKSKLIGMLFMKDFVEDYLKYQIDGGIRSPGHSFAVPTKNSRLNKFGNIVGRKTGLIKNTKQFFGSFNGITGVYERTNKGKKIKLVHALIKSATYVPKFPFYTIAKSLTDSVFSKNFAKSLNYAIRSRK